MPIEYKDLIKSHIIHPETFINAGFSGAQKGTVVPWKKVTVRPVQLKDIPHVQISYFDGRQDITKNYAGDEIAAKVDELLALPFSSITVRTTAEKIRVQITKKGKAIIHRDKVSEAKTEQPDLSHDRSKNLPLPMNRPDPFLQGVGIMTADGKIRAKMHDKFWQINRFLQLISQTTELDRLTGSPLHVIDCGCGSAQLTFATYHYLANVLNRPAQLTGIDVRDELLQKQTQLAAELGWADDVTFEASAIIDYTPPQSPDIVLALHACDTATDEALAQAIRWESRLIFSVPCCHHHLQTQLPTLEDAAPAHRPILRQGILKERLGDVLTDSFRALILRILGYRTDVVEFISSEHTARNLMIRAVKTASPGEQQFVDEYNALKAAWGVTPYLETLLGEKLFHKNLSSG